MSDELLMKALSASGDRMDGSLTPEQSSLMQAGTDWEPEFKVYREFKPTRDCIEYTMYFRAPLDGESVKYRLDFDVDVRDLETFFPEGISTPDVERAIAFMLKQAARTTQRVQTRVYRDTGVLPARQAWIGY